MGKADLSRAGPLQRMDMRDFPGHKCLRVGSSDKAAVTGDSVTYYYKASQISTLSFGISMAEGRAVMLGGICISSLRISALVADLASTLISPIPGFAIGSCPGPHPIQPRACSTVVVGRYGSLSIWYLELDLEPRL